jgi:hypothetical protein
MALDALSSLIEKNTGNFTPGQCDAGKVFSGFCDRAINKSLSVVSSTSRRHRAGERVGGLARHLTGPSKSLKDTTYFSLSSHGALIGSGPWRKSAGPATLAIVDAISERPVGIRLLCAAASDNTDSGPEGQSAAAQPIVSLRSGPLPVRLRRSLRRTRPITAQVDRSIYTSPLMAPDPPMLTRQRHAVARGSAALAL